MEINEIISTINTINAGMRNLKQAYTAIPVRFLLPNARQKIVLLENEISSLEHELSNLQQKVARVFPQIAPLIRSYSRIISDVKVAKALSDKAAELIANVPQLSSRYTVIFANQAQTDYARIKAGINELPNLDNQEMGSLTTRLDLISLQIIKLKETNPDESNIVKTIFDEISNHYTAIESVLSGLLEKILKSLEISQS